jgi:RimJ/RimL family protein N-acetyltransferase
MTDTNELITPRLRLRSWSSSDEDAMAAINRDPDVTRYLNRSVDAAAVEAFFGLVAEHWSEHGFGFWAIELLQPDASGSFIGFAGVVYPTFLPELADRPELGWRLARSAWGHGYAIEAATAARDNALGGLGLNELISIIHPGNVRSQRLATKLGMTRERQVFNPILKRPADVWQLSGPNNSTTVA